MGFPNRCGRPFAVEATSFWWPRRRAPPPSRRCRVNPLAEELSRSMELTCGPPVDRGIARMIAAKGMIISYATQAGQTAADGQGRNSPYTMAFLKNIEATEEIGAVRSWPIPPCRNASKPSDRRFGRRMNRHLRRLRPNKKPNSRGGRRSSRKRASGRSDDAMAHTRADWWMLEREQQWQSG
jgi:hypothetical protein